MNHRASTALLCLICLLAIFSVGCEAVTGGHYALPRGVTLSGDLVIAGGDAALEQGSRVTGGLFVVGGSVKANGQIDGDVLIAGGNIDFGPNALVRGVVRGAGGSVNIAQGAAVRSGDSVSLRTPGRWLGGLLAAFLLVPFLLIVALLVLISLRTSRGVSQSSAIETKPVAPADASASQLSAPTLRGSSPGGGVILGLVLVGVGILFLLQEFLNVDVWQYSWPLIFVAAGVLFFVAMVVSGRTYGGLAVPGSILTVMGLILLVQNAFDQFESWAYAWALIFPTALGIGRLIDGLWTGRPSLRESGIRQTWTGLVIFVLFAAFFELVLNLSGFFREDVGQLAFPALLIVVGVLLLLSRIISLGAPKPAGR